MIKKLFISFLILLMLGLGNAQAFENFTTYTEVDPSSNYTVTTNKIAFSISRSFSAYVYKDFGVDFWDGDFEFLVESEIVEYSTQGYNSTIALSNFIGDGKTTADAGEEYIQLYAFNGSVQIAEFDGSGGYVDNYPATSKNGILLYHIFERDINIGTYGTIYGRIYSDSDRTSLLDTLSVALHVDYDYRYLYGARSWDSDDIDVIIGYTQNLDLQQAIAGMTAIEMGVNF